jgi:hypothetical protein
MGLMAQELHGLICMKTMPMSAGFLRLFWFGLNWALRQNKSGFAEEEFPVSF